MGVRTSKTNINVVNRDKSFFYNKSKGLRKELDENSHSAGNWYRLKKKNKPNGWYWVIHFKMT